MTPNGIVTLRFDLRHFSLLRAQGLSAARAAITRQRQAALGMVAALLIAGQMGTPAGEAEQRQATLIQPNVLDTVRAVREGLTFPATDLARDASIALARRDSTMVEAGFAKSVTLAEAPVLSAAADDAPVAPELPQTIVPSESRIERPVLRSKTGESIILAAADLQRTSPPEAGRSLGAAGAVTEVSESIEIKSAMVRLAREAHDRSGKPVMSAQAVSEYLSLYVLRDRVAAIGESLALDPEQPVAGAWVANLGSGMDDALFQDGFGFGQHSFGAIAGVDAVTQSVFSDGDRLVYGAFASAYGVTPEEDFQWAPGLNETRGATFGLFAALDDGPFSLTAMVRADSARTLGYGASNQLDFSDTMQVLKAEVVARYRFNVSDWAVEPSAGLVYAAGKRDIAGLGPVQTRTEDAESLKVQLGVKASGVVYNKSGTSVEPSVTIMIAEELKDSGNVTFLSGSPTGPSDPITGKTVGSVSVGIDVKDDSGWTGFVRADGQVSDDDKPSAGVSAGVKTQW
jgi:outer membrane autotransporter protein